MNLVKRLGHNQFPTKFEHPNALAAHLEAQRLAQTEVGQVFVVYQPTHVVFVNNHGHLVSVPTDSDGKVSAGDMIMST